MPADSKDIIRFLGLMDQWFALFSQEAGTSTCPAVQAGAL